MKSQRISILNCRPIKAAFYAATLVVSMPTIAFSLPLSETSGFPVAPNSEGLSCYMETKEGQILNLQRLCEEVSAVKKATSDTAKSELISSSSNLSSSSVASKSVSKREDRKNYPVVPF